ncbi:hypothetical protein ABPG74_019579, partial [Tetrahymena malaccensis]
YIIQFLNPKCIPGCEICTNNIQQSCIKCFDGYQLDDNNNLCIYNQCLPNQFFQIDTSASNQQQGNCLSICNAQFQGSIQNNLCDQLQQCSFYTSTKTNFYNTLGIKDFFIYNNSSYVILFQDHLLIYDKKNVILVKNLTYNSNDLDIINLNGQQQTITLIFESEIKQLDLNTLTNAPLVQMKDLQDDKLFSTSNCLNLTQQDSCFTQIKQKDSSISPKMSIFSYGDKDQQDQQITEEQDPKKVQKYCFTPKQSDLYENKKIQNNFNLILQQQEN